MVCGNDDTLIGSVKNMRSPRLSVEQGQGEAARERHQYLRALAVRVETPCLVFEISYEENPFNIER
tara:strand:- start:832 stop:1029 length:198 start_codon:yes stop_codon:yes gene_type:complete